MEILNQWLELGQKLLSLVFVPLVIYTWKLAQEVTNYKNRQATLEQKQTDMQTQITTQFAEFKADLGMVRSLYQNLKDEAAMGIQTLGKEFREKLTESDKLLIKIGTTLDMILKDRD